MADISTTVGLNARGYLDTLGLLTQALKDFTDAARNADGASDDLSRHASRFEHLRPKESSIAKALKKDIASISEGYQALSTQMGGIAKTLDSQLSVLNKIVDAEKQRRVIARETAAEAERIAAATPKKQEYKRSGELNWRLSKIQEAMSPYDDYFLELYKKMRVKPVQIPESATPVVKERVAEAQEYAEKHLDTVRRDVFAKQMARVEQAKIKIASIYEAQEKLEQKISISPQRAIEIMTRIPAAPGTEKAKEQLEEELEVLRASLPLYKEINDVRISQASNEKRLSSEIVTQSKYVEKILNDELKASQIPYTRSPKLVEQLGGLKGAMSVRDDEFLKKYADVRIKPIDIPANASQEAINQAHQAEAQAERHLLATRRDIFARQTAIIEKAKLGIASIYEEREKEGKPIGISPEDAIRIMTRVPSAPGTTEAATELEEELRLLQESLSLYELINKIRISQIGNEKQLSAEISTQNKLVEKSYNDAVKKIDLDRAKETQAALTTGKQLEWLQSTFQKKHGREITGFGLVDVTRMGQELINVYSKTPIDFDTQFKEFKSATEVESFQKVILAMQTGNAKLIQQYPDLAKAATQYNRAIKYGEAESQRFVAHWDNFFRLILARGITLVFYSISNAIRQATVDAAELWRGIAEIQTISGEAKFSINDWSLSVLKLSNTYHFAQQDIVEAIYEITSNQIAAGQSAATFAATAAGLAKSTKSTLTESVNALSSIINSYNISIANAEIISAQLFKTVELGRVRLSDMANTLGRVTSMSSLLGISLEELQGLIDFITIGGVKFERASTYIVNMINALLKPSEKMKAFYTSIKVESGQAAIAMYGFAGVLERLLEYSHGEAGELAEIAKNLRAMTGFASVTRNVDEYKRMIAETKTAMKSYLEAQEYIYTGPGERLLEITTKAKNVFISGAQDILSALLSVDDWLNKKQGSAVADAIRGVTGASKIADLSAYVVPLGAFTASTLLGRSIAAVFNDAAVSKAWTAFGTKAGFAIAGAMALQIRISLNSQKLMEEASVDYIKMLKETKIAMEERYHAEIALVDDLIKKHMEQITAENESLNIALGERKAMWKDYYDEIAKPLEIATKSAEDLSSIFDSIIKMQQDVFVGYAFNPIDEMIRKVSVARDIFGRFDQYGLEHRLDIAQRFIPYAQSTLSELNKKIMEIEKSGGRAPESRFYSLLQMQRQDLISMMETIVGQYIQEVTGGEGMDTRDLYAALFETKDMETEWKDYFEDFRKMSEEVQKLLKEGVGKLDVLRADLAAVLTPEQKRMFERDIVPQQVFQDYLEESKNLYTAQERQATELAKLEKQKQGIGAGSAAEFMMPGQVFPTIYAALKVLSGQGVEEVAGPYAEAQKIQRQFMEWKGMIPPSKQEEFDRQLRAFIESLTYLNAGVNAKLKDLADTSIIKPWLSAEKLAAQTILSSIEQTLVQRLNPEAPPILQQTAGLAAGGSVGGPRGTDTVPAWLTPGEFVINQKSAQKFGPLLEHINARGYADGGYISRFLPWPNAVSGYPAQATLQQLYMQQFAMQNAVRSGGLGYFAAQALRQKQRREELSKKYGLMRWEGSTGYINPLQPDTQISFGSIEEFSQSPARSAGMPLGKQQPAITSIEEFSQDLAKGAGAYLVFDKLNKKSRKRMGMTNKQGEFIEFKNKREEITQQYKKDLFGALSASVKEKEAYDKSIAFDQLLHADQRRKELGRLQIEGAKLKASPLMWGGKNWFDKAYDKGGAGDYWRAGLTGAASAAAILTPFVTMPAAITMPTLAMPSSSGFGIGGFLKGIGNFLGIGPFKTVATTFGLIGAQEIYAAITDPNYDLFGKETPERLLKEYLFARLLGYGAKGSARLKRGGGGKLVPEGALNKPTTVKKIFGFAEGGWVPGYYAEGGGILSGHRNWFDKLFGRRASTANPDPSIWGLGNTAAAFGTGAGLAGLSIAAAHNPALLLKALPTSKIEAGVTALGVIGTELYNMIAAGLDKDREYKINPKRMLYSGIASLLFQKTLGLKNAVTGLSGGLSRKLGNIGLASFGAGEKEVINWLSEGSNYQFDPKRTGAAFLGGYGFDKLYSAGSALSSMTKLDPSGLWAAMGNYADGGWVKQPRGCYEFGGSVSGQTINNYSTTANITLQTSGNEAIDARRIMDNINRESHRGTRRLMNVS